jgi:hypothetical protein
MGKSSFPKPNWLERIWSKIGLQGRAIFWVLLSCLVFLAFALIFQSPNLHNSLLPHAGGATIPGIDR